MKANIIFDVFNVEFIFVGEEVNFSPFRTRSENCLKKIIKKNVVLTLVNFFDIIIFVPKDGKEEQKR